MDYQQILEEIQIEVSLVLTKGKVADYIPKLSSVPLKKFGMAVHTIDGDIFCSR